MPRPGQSPQHAIEATSVRRRLQEPEQAAGVLLSGRMLVLPTETCYAVFSDDQTLLRERLGLPDRAPLALHVAGVEEAAAWVQVGPPGVQRFLRRAWPGPVTAVLRARRPGMVHGGPRPGGPRATAEAVAVRCPDVAATREVLRITAEAGTALYAAAARRGSRTVHAPEELSAAAELEGLPYLDGGRCRFRQPATLVSLLGQADGQVQPRVVRAGVYDQRTVSRMSTFKLLLVCSGNTCRSPMAEAIARPMLRDRLGDREGISVGSAGTFAGSGAPASSEAVAVIAQMGGDLSSHRSKPVHADAVAEADLVLTMTQRHADDLRRAFPADAAKISRLIPDADIGDPIGGTLAQYQAVAEQIREGLSSRLDEELV